MIVLYILLSLVWLACGAGAAYLAHTGLHDDCEDECGPGEYPLGGIWVVWGPFLGFLVVLGAFALLCVCVIEHDRLWPVEDDEEDLPNG